MTESHLHHVREDHCPACSVKLNTAGNLDENDSEGPEPGALSVCMHCGEVLVFDEDMRLQRAAPSDIAELEPCDCLQLLSLSNFVKRHGRRH